MLCSSTQNIMTSDELLNNCFKPVNNTFYFKLKVTFDFTFKHTGQINHIKLVSTFRINIFGDVTPCDSVARCQGCGGTCRLHRHGKEMLITRYRTTRCHSQENGNVYSQYRSNPALQYLSYSSVIKSVFVISYGAFRCL
jgi:hypothetical protein